MAGISDIVQVTITANTRTPTRAGFGTPILLAYHDKWPELVRTYADLEDLTADGFDSHHPVYRMATALLSQNPRVERFKVGRLTSAHAHTQTLTMTSAVEGQKVKVTVISPSTGNATNVEYTIPAAATTTSVATAVAALIDAIAGVDASSASEVVTVTPTTGGEVVFLHSLENCSVADTTADAGYDDALTAIQAVDDDWYLVLLDVNSKANVDQVAAWTESRTKLFLAAIHNSAEAAGTGNVGSDLQAAGYDRTGVLFTRRPDQYPAAAWAGRVLPEDPGSITWAFKTLNGVTVDTLTPTQEENLHGVNVNTYETIGGLGVTRHGVAASGEYLDIIHGIDWLQARLQERIFAILANAGKVPYTDASVDMFVGEVLSVLGLGVERRFLAPGTLSARGPRVKDVDPADRANRILPDIKFGADLAGAVHKVRISGTLSV